MRLWILVALLAAPSAASAEQALIAVATNFKETAEELKREFEADGGHRITFTAGSTGKLYAQIVHGAPFDAFLAADRERPRRLEKEGRAVNGSRFTYAVGRLTLWSRDPGLVRAGGEVLHSGDFRKIAVANPRLAPYGVAAEQVLVKLGLLGKLKPRMVIGENVGQAFALAATGAAELGFVALSSILSNGGPEGGSRWDVPSDLYTPIRQDAVLLERAEDNSAAAEFPEFARQITAWMDAGLTLPEHKTQGIDSFPDALVTLFTGGIDPSCS